MDNNFNKSKKLLIVGLGNPGKDYELTRHNAGFMFMDFLIFKFNCENTEKKLKQSFIYSYKNIILAKPQTSMNRSGIGVKQVVDWYDVNVGKDFLLAHDDLDIPLGKYKIQFSKSPKVHNGVSSVQDHLGTNKFQRLRIGIDNRKDLRIEGMKYVLSKFNYAEFEKLKDTFELIDIPEVIKKKD